MMNSVNELVDDVLWRELVQHLERRKSTVSYRRPIVDLKLHYVVTDKTNDGKIIRRSGIRNAHSLLANFLSMLGYNWNLNYGLFNNNGSPRALQNTTYGIVVGTGTQTKSVLLTDLNAPIRPSNTGLVYSAEVYLGPISINNNASAVLREIRSFTNNTTGSSAINYTIAEIGVYGNPVNSYGLINGFNPYTPSTIFGSYYVLIAYDLLSPSVVVQPSQTVTFEYDWIVNV
jgi:hypothetical protein